MSSPVQPRPAQTDEIDIMQSAVRLIRFLRKHLIWAILFPALGLLGGYLNNVKGPVYQADLMLRSRTLKSDEITFLVSNYERANYPGLTRQEGRRIQRMSFKATKDDIYVFGQLSCQSTDTLLFNKLRQAITAYIESQPSVHATTKNTNDANTELVNEYTAVIRKAELLLEERNVDATMTYKNYRNIPDLTLLYEKRREAEIARRDSTAVSIVSDFAPQRMTFKKVVSLVIGFFIGVLATATMLFIIYFIDYYRKNEETA